MLSWLTLIPGVLSFLTSLQSSYFNAKVEMTMARLNCDRDVAEKLVTAAGQADHENTTRLGIIANNPLLTYLLLAFASPLVAFEWKVIVYDKILSLGSTDPLTGDVSNWANTVIYFLFGTPAVLALGKMWYARKGSEP